MVAPEVERALPLASSIAVVTGVIGQGGVARFTQAPGTTPRPATDDPWPSCSASSGDEDFLRSLAESVLQIIMVGAKRRGVEGLIGAGRHERSAERTTWRNGYRDRTLETRLGPLSLKVPKLRTGSCFPGFLEPRKPVEKALVAVVRRRRGSPARPRASSTTSCRPWAEPAKVPAMRSIVGMAAEG